MSAPSPRYVVTGATGHLGHLVVEELLARGVPADRVVATGRNLAKVADLAERGVRVAHVDLDEPDTLADVLEAGDVFLLVSTNDIAHRVQQHVDAVALAGKAGVARIAYTSAPRAGDTPLVLAPDHARTEEEIRASGLPFTILRDNWYIENYAQDLARAAETGVVASSTGAGRVASATRRDYAAAIAGALATEGHEGATYELGGDTAWTYADLAAAFAEVLGRDVVHQDLTPAEHLAALIAAGLDEGTAGFVVALDGNIRDGALDLPGDDLARLAGRPATGLVHSVRLLEQQG
ncbi:SDR family oxidoreductase [Nocardioides iriomotensis]|uniref:SDR family oxidoreductase n=1 Tax=Nocardioides iriomotensis TaxID=715784 RepID=A0A4Q5IXQ0_9ACTN|nr:SDR family oxidoreductase [Nocardioides iriomotensis]RYU09719.1 SDR family oxidoreductase [Nocardioides iriomotensis]